MEWLIEERNVPEHRRKIGDIIYLVVVLERLRALTVAPGKA